MYKLSTISKKLPATFPPISPALADPVEMTLNAAAGGGLLEGSEKDEEAKEAELEVVRVLVTLDIVMCKRDALLND